MRQTRKLKKRVNMTESKLKSLSFSKAAEKLTVPIDIFFSTKQMPS
jgi:hypothetical protein